VVSKRRVFSLHGRASSALLVVCLVVGVVPAVTAQEVAGTGVPDWVRTALSAKQNVPLAPWAGFAWADGGGYASRLPVMRFCRRVLGFWG